MNNLRNGLVSHPHKEFRWSKGYISQPVSNLSVATGSRTKHATSGLEKII